MNEIVGKARTVRELLKGVKYKIDYYQREFKWENKQLTDLVNDLVSKFLEAYDENHERKEVANYSHYFLGCIIINKKDNVNYLVDGQQRLTSLTLFIIFLNNLQADRDDSVSIKELIFSELYGQKSFNLVVNERTPYMEALFDGRGCEVSNDASESIK